MVNTIVGEAVEWPNAYCQLCGREIDGGVWYVDGKGMCKNCFLAADQPPEEGKE